MTKGLYCVIEGQDGVGKSTQLAMLCEYYESLGHEVVTVSEPGGLPRTDRLRRLIKDKSNAYRDDVNLLLFTAARVELWQSKILPALERGAVVLSSRNWWSTLAYQGEGGGLSLQLITGLTKQFLPADYVTPDRAVILLLDETERLRRLQERDSKSVSDSFESRPTDFQRRVSRGFRQIARTQGVPTVDANQSAEKIQTEIRQLFAGPN